MLRPDAVRSILLDQLAGMHPAASQSDDPSAALRKARWRALTVALVDWAAIVVLFLLRDLTAPFLVAAPTQEGLFTIAILAVATHAGFSLGQMEKYNAVVQALAEVPEEVRRCPPKTEAD